jgi:hypothetical protein
MERVSERTTMSVANARFRRKVNMRISMRRRVALLVMSRSRRRDNLIQTPIIAYE